MGWTVLALVFVDELLAVAAASVWGQHAAGSWVAVLAPLVVVAVWWGFASPKAPYAGPVSRPVVKVVVFTLTSVGLWAAGHRDWAVALFAFSVVINALAQLPSIRSLTELDPGRPTPGG
jgi:hypothetical protein